ncbi:MAG: potassium channel family protein [Candidatus Aureabacteria bacterium]|nr:potassium channel family protein [Candidatus Auribacterota bacterium]
MVLLIFFWYFLLHLVYLSPILFILLFSIVALALYIGKQENWSRIDSIYYAFITATTVGYGDLHPTRRKSKIGAIVIALLGLLLTGIIVASAVNSLSRAFAKKFDVQQIRAEARSGGAPCPPASSNQ